MAVMVKLQPRTRDLCNELTPASLGVERI